MSRVVSAHYYGRVENNEIIPCNMCFVNNRTLFCTHCNISICSSNQCCKIYSHYGNNSKLSICNLCFNKISEKLKPIVYHNKLILLKEKIKKKMLKKAVMLKNIQIE